jgi:hypothetical protein
MNLGQGPNDRGRARRPRRAGSVLVITVIFCALVGAILVAYLSMVTSQHKFSHRSQVWNDCIPLCEAGIEEAMSHLNYQGTLENFAINGWRLDNNAFRKQRTLNGGLMEMAISNVNPPVIYVRGRLQAPLQSNYITRSLQAQTKRNTRFAHGVLAKGKVVLSGIAARVDSFNSTNAAQSTGGQYDPAKATDHAIVATTSKVVGDFNIGNVSIYGRVATGPGATVTVGVNGNVGSTAWNDNSSYNGMIQPGYATDDANVYIPDANLPSPFAPLMPAAGVVNGTNYTYVLRDGDYRIGSISLGSSDKIIITGKARLLVDGATSVTGQAYIHVAPGASIEWFAGGGVTLSGGGVINSPGFAQNFSLIGLSTCNSVSYSGGSKFIGTIYAPYAAVKLTGNNDSIGAIVGASVDVSGGMSLHYDESLQSGPASRYLLSFWKEI